MCEQTSSVVTDQNGDGRSLSKLGSLEYDPAPESVAVAHVRPSYGLFIDGVFTEPSAHEQFVTLNPANEEVLATVARANSHDVDHAVRVARRAYENVWSKTSGAERSKYLFRIARLIQERARELAVIETLDNGKPIRESRDIDIPLAAAHFFYYAGWADKLDFAGFGPEPQPIGVAGQIIPWNFPLLMAAWKLAPALAAGNTCVLKPAETTSLSALVLAEILQQAELPPGVVNRLHRFDRGWSRHSATRRVKSQTTHPRVGWKGCEYRLRRRPHRRDD
jgi:aldehyde dehydrogenase (NAD+)